MYYRCPQSLWYGAGKGWETEQNVNNNYAAQVTSQGRPGRQEKKQRRRDVVCAHNAHNSSHVVFLVAAAAAPRY